jgi:hypothetical protein
MSHYNLWIGSNVTINSFESIIFFCRERHLIFVALCIWWLPSQTGLPQGLIRQIDNLRIPSEAFVQIGPVKNTSETSWNLINPARWKKDTVESQESDEEYESESIRHDNIGKDCKVFSLASKTKREKIQNELYTQGRFTLDNIRILIEGSVGSDLRRWEAGGKYQRCALPLDRKGGHTTLNCRRFKKIKNESWYNRTYRTTIR